MTSVTSSEKRGIENELNIRSILGAFMIGTEGTDVGRLMTMLGFGGGGSFDKMFFCNQSEVCRMMLVQPRKTLRTTLLHEVTITFREQMDGTLQQARYQNVKS